MRKFEAIFDETDAAYYAYRNSPQYHIDWANYVSKIRRRRNKKDKNTKKLD